MFIKSLCILSKKTGNLIRHIEFKKGVNFIVDSELSEKHNKVGKTTCLRLLDLSLGAKNKKGLYEDDDTKDVNVDLKNFIEKNKLYTELVLIDDFDKITQEVVIINELFNRGKKSINGVKVTYEEFLTCLNKLLFNNNQDVPSFRRSIKSFVRILMTEDNNQFLKVLDKYAKKSDYRALYNYLFDISDPKIDERLGKLKTDLKKLKDARARYKSVNNINEFPELQQNNIVLNQEISRLESELDDVVDRKSFQVNRKKINEVRQKYEMLNNQIGRVDFDISRTRGYIREIEDKSNNIVSEDLTKQFFQEVSLLLPEVTKTFTDLVEFNTQLNKNKLLYFYDRLDELNQLKQDLMDAITEISSVNSDFISLVEENKVDFYYEKLQKLEKLKINKALNDATINSVSNFDNQEKEILGKIVQLEESISKETMYYQEKMGIFNKYFTKVSESVNGEKPLVIYDPQTDSFPISISELNEGISTGTKKSLLAAYDIAYQLFAREIKKTVPNFIVHDVLESIEGDDLKSIVNEVESAEVQYISAILKEKLVSSGLSGGQISEMVILELSITNRLFESEVYNPDL